MEGTTEPTTNTTQQTQSPTQTNQTAPTTPTAEPKKPEVNVAEIKSTAISELLKTLGLESEDALKTVVTKAKEDAENQKTEVQKKDDAILETTRRLAQESEQRVMAEAKLAALKLGARMEMIDDLVIVAKAKVTKDKDINAVITEIKDGTTGSVYFTTKEEEEQSKKQKNVTKVKPTTQTNQTAVTQKTQTNEKYEGSMAQKILSTRQKPKSHYFS